MPATEQPRTWYYDGPYTHGVAGLACVTDDGPFENMAGTGPDGEFTGTTGEMVTDLLRQGFVEIDTDVPGLEAAWYATVGVIDEDPEPPGLLAPWRVTTPGGAEWHDATDDDARANLARHLIAAGRMEPEAWAAQVADATGGR